MGSAPFLITWGIFFMQIFPNPLQIRNDVSVCKNILRFCILDGYS